MKDRAKAQRLHYDWTKVDAWLKNNADKSYTEFMVVFPKFPFTDATYYTRKRKMFGGSSRSGASRKSLYETIGTMDMKEVKDMDALTAMKRILAIMDKQVRTHVEIIRLSEPDSIEIRRFTRS
jgi:hypothetical protein